MEWYNFWMALLGMQTIIFKSGDWRGQFGPLLSPYQPMTSRHHLIWHSSEKITLLQSTGFNIEHSLHHFFPFKNGFFTTILERSPPVRNTLWTVHNKTFLGILERKCTAFAEWNGFFTHSRHNTLFSRIVNFSGLPILLKFSTFPVAWNFSIDRVLMIGTF